RFRNDTPCRCEPTATPAADAPARRCASSAPSLLSRGRAALRATLDGFQCCASSSPFLSLHSHEPERRNSPRPRVDSFQRHSDHFVTHEIVLAVTWTIWELQVWQDSDGLHDYCRGACTCRG